MPRHSSYIPTRFVMNKDGEYIAFLDREWLAYDEPRKTWRGNVSQKKGTYYWYVKLAGSPTGHWLTMHAHLSDALKEIAGNGYKVVQYDGTNWPQANFDARSGDWIRWDKYKKEWKQFNRETEKFEPATPVRAGSK